MEEQRGFRAEAFRGARGCGGAEGGDGEGCREGCKEERRQRFRGQGAGREADSPVGGLAGSNGERLQPRWVYGAIPFGLKGHPGSGAEVSSW